ncbi:putative bifunctional diguanylate cyclase/phosphodiesterase [Sulfurospirillum multivorans]|uniref:Diguanylate cyclase n=2 Tax=Sulfurospirillum multivorans TaxID=66821 RepID=A0AA86E054_SULMK|nr:GGDEF domain-containing phosphodiesterase [Sulfurospirillum multivorans]AHJ13320.1 diguanylate cyclase [Sulfurospirillum multivorans DSM 12446]QEH06810.1 diguanylate cyclase [Sulfurospirillum multivorans]
MHIRISPLRIVLIYALFATLWILFSDRLVESLIDNVAYLTLIQTYKGLFFIIVTSLLLYGLIRATVTELEMMQKKLQVHEERLEYVIQGANLGYWDWDYVHQHHIVNDQWLSFLGLKREDIEDDVTDWEERIHPEDRMLTHKAVENTIKHHQPYVVEFRMRHKDGHWVWIEGSGAVVERNAKTGAPLRLAGTHRDISDRKNAQRDMLFLAHNDTLTKLPNRVYLRQELEQRLMEESSLCFLFLDLDRFKTINDMYGHTIGDKVIQVVAERLKSVLNPSDFIACVGGDEFVILSNEALHVEALCQKLIKGLDAPIAISDEQFKLSVSIGVACCPHDGKSFEALFKNADTAMYEAKTHPTKNYLFYMSSMTEHLLTISKFDNDLKHAIENDEFILHYQPQINLHSNAIIGMEALVRWQHPVKGLLSPYNFIARAEETRLIIPLGLFIFKKALEQAKRWQDENFFNGIIAINISNVQIEEEDFIEQIEAIRQKIEVSALSIELEVTESSFMNNPMQSSKTLQKLENLGYKISIDDFGTGYSSLSYLKQLPLHKLKIDRSFIRDLPRDRDDQAISKAIIALGKTLELEVLAEGVETEEQKAFLIDNGCDSMQGFLFAKPMSAEALESFLHQN